MRKPLNRWFHALMVTGLIAASGCASLVTPDVQTERKALRAGNYSLDQTHVAVHFRINHLGFADYLGRFETVQATLTFDEDDPTTAQVDAEIDMTSLDIANDEFAATLMGPDWFDVEAHPVARFTSDAITVTGETSGTMTGELTLHGVTAPVTFFVTFNGGARDLLRSAYVTGFSAHADIDRTDFGISRLSGVITDTVRIEIEAEFLRG